jgi:GNAT superfamily N-acetyltransferase
MPLYELRVDLPDDPGRLAALATALAEHDVNILSLAVHGKDATTVTDDLVIDMRNVNVLGSLICALHEISPQMSITRTDAHALVDAPTRALDTAAWLARRPDQVGRALARLVGAEEAERAVRNPAGRQATGSAGTGSAGTGSAGTGSAGTGSAGTGSAGTGSAGTGSAGTGGPGAEAASDNAKGDGAPARGAAQEAAAEVAPPHRLTVGIPGSGRLSVWRRWAPFTITEHARAQALARLAGELNRAAPPGGSAGTGKEQGSAWFIQLADGAEVVVRRGRAPDVPAIMEMHRRCSPATLRQRYFTAGQPPRPLLARLAGTSAGGRSLIAATSDGQVVAVANLVTTPPDHDTAEMAFLVDDAWQGRGLGTALARRVADLAASLGITELRSCALAANTGFPRMLRRAGYDITSRVNGAVLELRTSRTPAGDGNGRASEADDVRCRPARGD